MNWRFYYRMLRRYEREYARSRRRADPSLDGPRRLVFQLRSADFYWSMLQ